MKTSQSSKRPLWLRLMLWSVIILFIATFAMTMNTMPTHAAAYSTGKASDTLDSGYNRTAAVKYAQTYGNDFYNIDKSYRYNKAGVPEDCTNFVSHALYAGGIDDSDIADPTTLAQWLAQKNSYAQLVVEASTPSGPPTPPAGLQQGDVILYAWNGLVGDPFGNFAWDHAAIVTDTTKSDDIRIAEHSF